MYILLQFCFHFNYVNFVFYVRHMALVLPFQFYIVPVTCFRRSPIFADNIEMLLTSFSLARFHS